MIKEYACIIDPRELVDTSPFVLIHLRMGPIEYDHETRIFKVRKGWHLSEMSFVNIAGVNHQKYIFIGKEDAE